MLTDLGTFGGRNSHADFINNSGLVVGSADADPSQPISGGAAQLAPPALPAASASEKWYGWQILAADAATFTAWLQAHYDNKPALQQGLEHRFSPDYKVAFDAWLQTDPFANGDSQHETAVEPDDFAWGTTVVAAFQIGRRAQGAAANIGTAVSTDAGRTWSKVLYVDTFTGATDLVMDPRGSVARIAALVGEPDARLPFVDEHTAELGTNHTVSGNPGRFRTGPVTLRLDDEWVANQTARDRWATTALALPMLLRYRYPLRPGHRAA